MEFMDVLRRGIAAEHKQSALRHCLDDVMTKLRSLHRRQKKIPPWYFVLGLPQSGKTSLLQREADSHWQCVGRYRDADNADNNSRWGCDWWLAENAVLVDIHCRFAPAGESGSNDSWPQFLDLLRRYRKRDAASAAVIVISADYLQHDDAEQRQKQARQLKQQLQELQLTSQRRIACFVVISRCDAMNGFTDYFATLSPEERQQIWGVTQAPDAGAEELAAQLTTLQNTLHNQLPHRLQSERDAIFRSGMVALPTQFDALCTRCIELCAAIFPKTPTWETPTLRGIYFTANKNQSSSYFTDRLFSEVILADNLPAPITHQRRFSSISTPRIATVAGVAIAILLLVSWCTAFNYQWRVIDRTQTLLQHHMSSFSRHENGNPRSLTHANAALSTLEEAATMTKNNAAWIAWLGMRDGSLQEAVISSHEQVLEQQWLPALSDELLRWLLARSDNTDEEFNALKAWLMLVSPQHRDVGYLLHWLDGADAFAMSKRDIIKTRLQQLQQHNPQFAVPFADLTAVLPLQQRLASVSPQQRIYAQWNAQFDQKTLALKPLLGVHADDVFDAHDQNVWNMPLFYTADAFGKLRFDAQMPELQLLAREQWVLGDAVRPMDDIQRAQIAQALRQRYLGNYADAWKNLFNSISLRKTPDTTSLLTQLQVLSDNAASPLAALLRISEENTKMLPQQQSAISVTQDRNTTLSTTLAELRSWLNTIYHADDVGNAALKTGTAGSEMLSPPHKTLIFSEELPAPVSQWVAALAHEASNSIANTASNSLDSAWHQQVADFCRANFGGHYPFDAHASASTSYSNFVDYFRPGGIEDNFVRSRLADAIDRESWHLKPGATVKLSAHTLAMLAQAQKIRSAFFHGDTPGFSYRITPVRMSANLQQFAINVGSSRLGSSRLEYSHGPRRATQFSWPQDSNTLSTEFTSLSGSSITRTYDGVWGLYRLLDTATQIHPADSNGGRMVLREGLQNIELAVVSAQGNPLQRDLLAGYDCISHLR